MNEIIEQEVLCPVPISNEQEESLERLGHHISLHVSSGISIGKEMLFLKSITPHGEFAKVVGWKFGIKKSQCQNYMRVANAFGQKPTRVGFSVKALIELAKAPEPEEALEVASQQETLTVKQAKQIVDLQKKVDEQKKLNEAIKPNLSNLIPGLMALHKSGGLPEATALEFSKIDKDIQSLVILPKYQDDQRLKAQIDKLKEDKTRALERESKEREGREALQKNYDSAVKEGTQTVIKNKDEEIRRKEKELDQLRVDMRSEIETKQTAIIEKRVRAEVQSDIKKERTAKEKAEREVQKHRDRANALASENLAERARAESAESELKSAQPVEKDALHARSLGFLVSDLQSVFSKIESDCEPYQRKLSESKVRELMAVINSYLGSASEIIDMEM